VSLAQNNAPVAWTDSKTGITFDTWSATDAPPNGDSEGPQTSGGFTFGVALPADALTTDATEFIGYMVCINPVKGKNSPG
jgi:cellobiose dehydrogenase (acceptor)